jgi:hypothetical protein
MLTGAQSVVGEAVAAVKVSGNTIQIGNPQVLGDGILVTPEGVSIDGFLLSTLLNRINSLEAIVRSLQSSTTTP